MIPPKADSRIEAMKHEFRELSLEARSIEMACTALVRKLRDNPAIPGRDRLLNTCVSLPAMCARFQDEIKDIKEDCERDPEKAGYYER